MKHIVIDARELRTGSGRYVERMIHYLQQVDRTHHYTILLKPQDFDGWQPANPNFKKQATPYKEFTFGEQLGFKGQLDALEPDLVHFPFVQQPVLYRGKVVTTMQDLTTIRFRNPTKNPAVFTLKREVYKWVNKYVARKSQAILTISDFVKQDIVQFTGIQAAKITVTYESSDPIPDAPEAIPAVDGKQFIMYVGRPLPHKNLPRLVEAFAILQKQFPDLHLLLVGKKDPLHFALEKRWQQQGIANIVMSGFASEGQLKWAYQNCRAYTFPSLSEGFGLPALEALRHGAPLVSSNATCSPEIYGDAALYFDPLNPQDMADKIAAMISDDKLRRQYITRGYKQADKYSWERMAEQTLAVYRQVLNED